MGRILPVKVLIKAKDGLTGRLSAMRKGVRGLEKGLKGLGKIAAIGGVAFGGAALVEHLRESVVKSREFGESMGLLQTFLGGNVKRAGQLRGEIISLSKATGKALPDLTRGVADTVSAFGDDKQTMKRATIVAKAATAGFTETKDALALLSVVSKNYGDTSAGALKHVADLSFQVVKDGQTTFPDLANAMQTVAPNAKAAGVEMKELFAVFSTGTGVVGNADGVAVKFRASLAALTKPSAGMKKALKALRSEGIKSGADLLKKRGFVGALRAVRGTTDGTIESFNQLIPRVEAQGLALALTGAQGAKFARDLEHMAKAEGNLDGAVRDATGGFNKTNHALKVSEARTAALQVKIGTLAGPVLGRAKMAFAEFSEGLLSEVSPALSALSGGSGEVGVSMRELGGDVGELLKGLLAATVAAKGLLSIVGEGLAAGAAIVATDPSSVIKRAAKGAAKGAVFGPVGVAVGVVNEVLGSGRSKETDAIIERAKRRIETKARIASNQVERIGGTMLNDEDRRPGSLSRGQAGRGEIRVKFENAPAGLRVEEIKGQGLDVVAEVGRRMVGAF